MDANQYVLVHGMRQTRSILERWGEDPWPVIRTWVGGAVLIALALLCGVTLVASLARPDYGFHYGPTAPGGPQPIEVLQVLGRNSLVLALHAFACVAGFIAGATLPLTASRYKGFKRTIHEKARPIAFGWVIGVTCFSLFTQTVGLGLVGATIAWDEHISPVLLVVTALPHALLELTAVFLPLAAWTIASRKGEWDQLLAATFVTVAIAIPMLVVAATWEVYIWPDILSAVSPWPGPT
ncbi:MAG TPA: stage II sporulation protein M [Solirubrobacterales bacterium]|nr:stage II sporulation protein M [Solirubrobacterales bacterium]